MRTEQGECPRGLDNCQSLAAILSDDPPGATFVCCGLGKPESREAYRGTQRDIFRHCFKSEETDSMFDHDHIDLLDIIEVTSKAMATLKRIELEQCGGPGN